jgi:hypothetical protein
MACSVGAALALLLLVGCGGSSPGGAPVERAAPRGVQLTCDDRPLGAVRGGGGAGSIRLGPVELLGLGRLGGAGVARRGGAKVPLLVEPDTAVTIRIDAPRDSVAFIPQPLGVFPPGRPYAPLPPEASATLTVAACAPAPGADSRVYLPSFVAIARPACARLEVEGGDGGGAARTVSFGAGPCRRRA